VRIAIASPGYPPTLGGVEQVVARTAQALARAGHTVEVFAQERGDLGPPPGSRGGGAGRAYADGSTAAVASASASASAHVERDGRVTVHRFRSHGPHDFPVAPGLWRALAARSGDFDLVHGHGYHTLTGLAAALCSRVPFVFSPHYHATGHSPARATLHRVYRPLGGLVMHRARAVVCVSGAEAGLVAEHFPGEAAKCVIVPNGVERTPILRAEPYPDQPPTVLSVGRLERYKRVDRLIEAFAQLDVFVTDEGFGLGDRAGAPRLVVIGAGPDRARLTAQAAELGLTGRPADCGGVEFLGQVEDERLHRWLRTCRVLCSLSEHEAFGLAPAEALVAGAPVLLSDIPAHRELSACGPVELVGPGESALALAERLRRTLDTPPTPAAASVLDWDEVAQRLAKIYLNVLAAVPAVTG
jgi:glycosyltransferase involved in cell wall biosynthesis